MMAIMSIGSWLVGAVTLVTGGDVEAPAPVVAARAAFEKNLAGAALGITGETTHSGLPARFRLDLGPGGRFLLSTEGRTSRAVGFDGKEVWEIDGASPAYPLVLLHRERALATTWVWTGEWANEEGPFEWDVAGQDENGARLDLQLRDGLLEAALSVAPDGRPRTLSFPETFGGGSLQFEDWRTGKHGTFPWRITWKEPGSRPVVYATEDIQPSEDPERAFAAPAGAGSDAVFDPDVGPSIEARRAGRGHLFVRPKVNGQDVGWFLFDSGAGGTMITKAAADRLSLPSFGEVAVSGMGGPPTIRPLRQTETIRLGPLTLQGLAVSETADMGMADRMLGEPCAGALGWDVFLRSVIEIDPQVPSIALHDPATYSPTEGHWEDLSLHWKVPYIRARFEGDREGLFCVDTGAGTTGVLFHSLATHTLGLTEGREGEALSGRGAGGSFEMLEVELEWFEVAGNRVAPAKALLSTGEDGEADPYALGFIGSGFLGPRRLVFDYGRRRLGFLER